MINYQSNISSLRSIGAQQSADYAANQPFPHISLDNFFYEGVMSEVIAEVDAVHQAKATGSFLNKRTEHNKYTFEPEDVGVNTNRLVTFLNSGPFLSYIEKLTGIPNLIADPSYFGGGLHIIENGGFLEIHADFNHLKRYNLERRVNLLLYLNKNWKPEFQGKLELWDYKSRTLVKDIAPDFNRCVIFSTTRESLHMGIQCRSCVLLINPGDLSHFTTTRTPGNQRFKTHATLSIIYPQVITQREEHQE